MSSGRPAAGYRRVARPALSGLQRDRQAVGGELLGEKIAVGQQVRPGVGQQQPTTGQLLPMLADGSVRQVETDRSLIGVRLTDEKVRPG